MKETLLSVTDVAERLGISKHTLWSWKYQRRIQFVKIGRRIMFRLADIEAFINVALVEPRPRREVL
jgi:excisionase family DNA binding protein